MQEIIEQNLNLEKENKSMNEIIKNANEENIKLKEESDNYFKGLDYIKKKINKVNKVSGIILIVGCAVFIGVVIFNIAYYLLSK